MAYLLILLGVCGVVLGVFILNDGLSITRKADTTKVDDGDLVFKDISPLGQFSKDPSVKKLKSIGFGIGMILFFGFMIVLTIMENFF